MKPIKDRLYKKELHSFGQWSDEEADTLTIATHDGYWIGEFDKCDEDWVDKLINAYNNQE